MHRETVGAGRWAPWEKGFCRISWRGCRPRWKGKCKWAGRREIVPWREEGCGEETRSESCLVLRTAELLRARKQGKFQTDTELRGWRSPQPWESS